ncbi:MAG: DUF1015 domain-containing protein [Bacteroidales bacterium]|nr:DUF1015 domain-containing protein [Bacteroidales bacterium]
MVKIKAFRGFRPDQDLAGKIACRPYDVLSSAEALAESAGNPYSYYHVIKSEIDLPPGTDPYSPEVYEQAKNTLYRFIDEGILIQDALPCLYIYAQTMWGRTQYGLVACAAVSDYLGNVIKKHELTRPDKETDRKTHIQVTGFNTEPVFFAYSDHNEIDRIVENHAIKTPEYDFEAADGIRHRLWVISDPDTIGRIGEIFEKEIPSTYIADGHHRTAAAAHVGEERRNRNKDHRGDEEYNFFMAVHFPASQLAILDYNRVVKDLNGYTAEQFIQKLSEVFEVVPQGEHEYKPQKHREFSLYLKGQWYLLRAPDCYYNESDPVGCLDVTVLSRLMFEPILDIRDLRNSHRIDFVGGIRGLQALKSRVDSGEMAAAFALYPVSMEQLIRIADTGNIMPPKVTWFEPKLRSGLVLHSLESVHT